MDSNTKQYRCMHSLRAFSSDPLITLGTHELVFQHRKWPYLEKGRKRDESV